MNEGKNLLFVGVGGQGILLASEILSQTAMLSGFDVKKSEVHGMAQRGGIVTSHIRYASRVFSPLIMKGSADIILAFEKAEGYRWLEYLSPTGQLITATTEIIPTTVYSTGAEYPHNVIDEMRAQNVNLLAVDVAQVAENLGNLRVANVVLLGVLSTRLDLPHNRWTESISALVPPKHKELNLKAFEEGRRLGSAAP